ncbi:MAG TPA: AMP-binding protein [Pyrinomonadaceae bacterium]
MSDTFLKRLVDSFGSRPENVAMRIVGDESEIYTFGRTLEMVRSIAFRLELEDVAFGDRVALIGENHPSWAIAYLGVLYRGAVVVPMDPHGETATLANFLENSEAKLVFVGSETLNKFDEVLQESGREIPSVVWSISANADDRFADWSSTPFPESFASQIPSSDSDDIALLMYTSGTTGTPKGVPLTHGNILAELDGINEMLHLSDKEKILSLLPLFHAYLQIVNLWVSSTFGCEVGYLKELSPAALAEAMNEFKPTILTTVPRLWYLFHKKIFDTVKSKPLPVRTLFRGMLALNGFTRETLNLNLGRKLFGKVHESFGGHLRLAVSAGSRFDETVARDFHKLGFTILQGYGLTETSGAATGTYETDNVVGSVGKPLKGTEIKLDEPDKNGVGEVLIRGGAVFSGYYKNPEATRDAFTDDGWFRSGDLGRIDDHGHLYIVGRAKDVIVLPSGKNVHPEDVEAHYLKSPLVEELAVIGIRDAEGGAGAEKLAAVVVPNFEFLRHEKIANSKEAIRHGLDNLGRELPEYQRVRDYIIRTDPLPRTATRKIKRFELMRLVENSNGNSQFENRKPRDVSTADRELLDSDVGRAVVAVVKNSQKDPDTSIHPNMNLEIDLGLDSLARAETIAALEQVFATDFAAEEASTALTVGDVIAMVRKHGIESAIGDSIELNWASIVEKADASVPEIQPILKRRRFFVPFAWFVYRCFHLVCRVLFRLEVRGLENLNSMRPAEGAHNTFLVCPNHQSFLDPFVVCSNYPLRFFRDTFHVGASEFWQGGLMTWLSRLLQVVPVNPDTELMRAMRAGAAGLKNGRILHIYPEGERGFDGQFHEFKKGAAILATELNLPIIPVALDGLYKVWPRHSWRIRLAKVKVRFGKPFYAGDILPPAARDLTPAEKYTLVIDHLKQTIIEMAEDMRRDAAL